MPFELDRTLRAYRIGDPDGRYPIFSTEGARRRSGRWHAAPTAVIYTAEHYSTALLEALVHGGGALPPNQHYVEVTLDAGLSYETFSEPAYPGWDAADVAVARSYGEAWAREARSLLLIVPSIVARLDHNVLINPDHPEFARVRASLHRPVWWDQRLFSPSTP